MNNNNRLALVTEFTFLDPLLICLVWIKCLGLNLMNVYIIEI